MPVRPLLALAAVLALVTGCTDDAEPPSPRVQDGVSVVESGRPCEPQPAVPGPLPEAYPQALVLPAGSLVTDVREQAGAQLVTGRVEGDASAVLEHFRAAAEPAGFAVIRDEDEGRAGRLQLFGVGSEVGVTVAQLTCPAGSTGFTLSVRRTVS